MCKVECYGEGRRELWWKVGSEMGLLGLLKLK
jgi:hypothetical protein